MTETAAPLLPARRTLFERWTHRLQVDPRVARLWRWLAPTLITVLAAVLRLWNLANPNAFVFDETYYVKDAWSQWNLGYAGSWPDDANARFLGGETDIFTTTGSFVVHPPLGKMLIGLGMAIFGPESTFGWRIAAAVFGTATVLLLYFVAKTMTGSIAFASIAAGLMAIDGLAIALSRVALLDIFLTFFIVLTFWFVLLDHRQHLARLAAASGAEPAHPRDDGEPARRGSGLGPLLWNRPWLLAAGAAVGAATAVKWSGAYVAAGLGIYLVVVDALARRRAHREGWVAGGILQGAIAFVLFIPIAAVVYVASWTGWLVTDGGYKRNPGEGSALANLLAYHQSILGFHVGLTSTHSYASPAWQWPLLVRPTSMYYADDAGTVQNIYSMPNPLIWYASVAAAVYLVWRFAVSRDWRHAIVLLGIGVTYVPWLLYPTRTIFQFYTIAILPFLLLALTFALRDLAARTGDEHRRRTGQRLVWVFLVVAVLLSAFWYPVISSSPVPYLYWQLHNWLPTWV